MNEKICCFFGHRKIDRSGELESRLQREIEGLITEENVNVFLFGSKSRFDDLCYETVSGLKLKYPTIRRIYVRAEYRHINEDYRNYLLENYEDTYYSEKAIGGGKAVYVERNCEMIDKSDFCIAYYKADYKPPMRKNSRKDLTAYQPNSGTALAFEYAVRKKKFIINLATP